MAFLNNGLSLMGVEQSWVSIIKGLVLLVAVAFDVSTSSRIARRSVPVPEPQEARPVPRRSSTRRCRARAVQRLRPRRCPTHGRRAHRPPPQPEGERGIMRKSLVAMRRQRSLLVLTGCSTESETATETPPPQRVGGGRGGRPPRPAPPTPSSASRCPHKTSENWVLAGELFDDGLDGGRLQGRRAVLGRCLGRRTQQTQIYTMVTQRAKVIVIGAEDGKQLTTQVEAAEAAGVPVIAYDRLIKPRTRLLRRVRQLQGRPAAGPGAARRPGQAQG